MQKTKQSLGIMSTMLQESCGAPAAKLMTHWVWTMLSFRSVVLGAAHSSRRAPFVSIRYGMREALAIGCEQGLEVLWVRHQRVNQALWRGLEGLGLQPFVADPADRLPTVNTIKVSSCCAPCIL